jgi:hypothetical protein
MMMQLALFLSSSFQVEERYLILLFSSSSFSSFPTWHSTNNRKTTIFSSSVCRAMALLNLSCHQVSWRETQRDRERASKRRKVISTKKTAGIKKTSLPSLPILFVRYNE